MSNTLPLVGRAGERSEPRVGVARFRDIVDAARDLTTPTPTPPHKGEGFNVTPSNFHLAQRRLRGGQARDRHAERRTRHVIEPDFVAKGDRGRIAAVLAANAELEIFTDFAAALRGDAHKLADAVAVD